MADPVAQRLWKVAQRKGGAIMLFDVPCEDITCGLAKGLLVPAGISHFKATDELRAEAAPGKEVDG